MPAVHEMTWVPNHRRWVRQYKGRRYVVSCRQLAQLVGHAVPETKDGSRPYANAWWKVKEAELDVPEPIPNQADIEECLRRRDWCRANGDAEGAEFFDRLSRVPETGFLGGVSLWELNRRLTARKKLNEGGIESPPPDQISESLVSQLSDDTRWEDRFRDGCSRAVPDEETIGVLTERYLSLRQVHVSPRAHKGIRDKLEYFRDQQGPSLSIKVVDESRWRSFCESVVGKVDAEDWSGGWGKQVLAHARAFLTWADEEGLTTVPRNLQSKQYRIAEPPPEIKVISIEDVRRLYEIATGQTRLHCLLMLNCGMYGADISDLRHEEVDWDAGRIIRKRSKAVNYGNAPKVDYKLWVETFQLLKEYRSKDPERVLVTKSGGPWVENRYVGDRLNSFDNVATNFTRLRKLLKAEGRDVGPPKLLRKTSASMLENHVEYGRYAQYFLAQSPKTVAERHYVQPSRERFDSALAWLHSQYFPTA